MINSYSCLLYTSGLGHIGRQVAGIAKAMGAKVQYYSTSGQNATSDYQQVDFDTLLKTSDIISIHAPLNEKTHYLFNEEALRKMKPTAYLINVGRGGIIEEKALVKVLKMCIRDRDILPQERLEIHMTKNSDQTRRMTFVPYGEKYQQLLEEMKICYSL